MTVKKIFRKIHLYLAVASGLVVFIVCITGALWSFSPEIENLTQAYRHVKIEDKEWVPAIQLKSIAEKHTGGQANHIYFWGNDKAATVDVERDNIEYTVYINPYNRKVLKVKDDSSGFFPFILQGHYELWLGDTGTIIIKWSTFIFFLMLVTGIILWWPRNKSARKQRFRIKWKASPKRLNYDLHNVLGFYACWILLFSTLTGLVWTFEFVYKAEHWLANGGKVVPQSPRPISDITKTASVKNKTIDDILLKYLQQYESTHLSRVVFPKADSDVYSIMIFPDNNLYSYDQYFFDRYTLEEIPVSSNGLYNKASTSEKLDRMNYDIHIGNILGLPGRIAMFFAALIGASLPFSGFYIWWGRIKKKDKKLKNSLRFS